MLINKDQFCTAWLALIRPVGLFLLLIGECTAQELYPGLVGMKRKHIQVVMKNEPFIDYQKSHVTYRLSANVKQTVLYDADTCKAYYWSVEESAVNDFTQALKNAGMSGRYKRSSTKTGDEVATIFLVDSKVTNAAVGNGRAAKNLTRRSKAVKEQANPEPSYYKASVLPPKEERVRQEWDSVKALNVFGWKIE